MSNTNNGCGSGNCACKSAASVQRRDPFDFTDYGTPLRHADIDVTLEIDGESVTVPAGTSVMRAAIEAGVNVPKLCATDSLEPFGSCRLCLVEIEGQKGYPASCTTPVEAGMKVRTQSRPPAVAAQGRDGALHLRSPARLPHLPRQRRLRAAGHGGRRRPARSALRLRRREPPEGQEGRIESVLHLRPVEVHRLQPLRARLRGNAGHLRADDRRARLRIARLAASENEPFMESECVSCGACVAACPTATLQEKTVIMLGQPEHSVVTTCAYCGVGCSLQGRDEGQRSRAHGAEQERPGERRPLVREGPLRVGLRDAQGPHHEADDPREDHRPVARSVVGRGDRLRGVANSSRIQAKYGRDSIGGITSSRCTNEETYLVQKLVRAAFGNNNVDTCARVCHSPTGYGLKTDARRPRPARRLSSRSRRPT